MPKFEFQLTHTITAATTISVTAKDEDEAREKAQAKLDKAVDGITYTLPKDWEADTESDIEQQ